MTWNEAQLTERDGYHIIPCRRQYYISSRLCVLLMSLHSILLFAFAKNTNLQAKLNRSGKVDDLRWNKNYIITVSVR